MPTRAERPLLQQLAGDDRRSIGRSAQVVRRVLRQRALLGELVDGLDDDDAIVRMRAADALEKVTVQRPAWLAAHKQALLRHADTSLQKEVRWHVAQMLPRLELAPAERRRVYATVRGWLGDPSSIVKACALQALVELGGDDAVLRADTLALARRHTGTGPPALRARARKLLARC